MRVTVATPNVKPTCGMPCSSASTVCMALPIGRQFCAGQNQLPHYFVLERHTPRLAPALADYLARPGFSSLTGCTGVPRLRGHVCIGGFPQVFNKEYAHQRAGQAHTPNKWISACPPPYCPTCYSRKCPPCWAVRHGSSQYVPDREPNTPTLQRSGQSEASSSLTPFRLKLLKSSGSTEIVFCAQREKKNRTARA